MTSAMRANSRPGAGGLPTEGVKLWRFYELVRPGGAWDYKWRLLTLLHLPKDSEFWIPVRDDPAPEALYFDVWANIHYAYVGRAQGIPQWLLSWAQQHVGVWDRGDEISLDIGYRLFDKYKWNLSGWELASEIRYALGKYRSGTNFSLKRPFAFFWERQ